jgi:hypothetical protein
LHSGPTEQEKMIVSHTFTILVHHGLVLGPLLLNLSALMLLANLFAFPELMMKYGIFVRFSKTWGFIYIHTYIHIHIYLFIFMNAAHCSPF